VTRLKSAFRPTLLLNLGISGNMVEIFQFTIGPTMHYSPTLATLVRNSGQLGQSRAAEDDRVLPDRKPTSQRRVESGKKPILLNDDERRRLAATQAPDNMVESFGFTIERAMTI